MDTLFDRLCTDMAPLFAPPPGMFEVDPNAPDPEYPCPICLVREDDDPVPGTMCGNMPYAPMCFACGQSICGACGPQTHMSGAECPTCRMRTDAASDEDLVKFLRGLLDRSPGRHTPRAQYNLGLSFYAGRGVAEDMGEAMKWMREAAEGGHRGAQNFVGVQLHFGNEPIVQDEVEGARWYRKSAEQGYHEGQFNYGVVLQCGSGVAQDHAAAAYWFLKAAEQGHPDAQYSIGVMLAEGRGVDNDDGQAVAWLRKAAKAGDADAVCYLKALCDRLATRPGLNRDDQRCWLCTAAGDDLKTCSQCGCARYCSPECPTAHWKRGHKRACPTLQKPARH